MKYRSKSSAVACFLFICCAATLSFAADGGFGQKKNPCGPEPLARCRKPPTCTPDGWVFGPILPAGSTCETTSFQPGICDGGGNCNLAPPPVTGSLAPAYYLVTILYAPPGIKSKASYIDGSSAGSSTSTADMFGAGFKVGITGNVIATADYQATIQTSGSLQVTKTTKSELDISPVTDSIQHGQDLFYLWLNPLISYSQLPAPGMPIDISFATVDNAPINVVPLTANELTNQEPIATWKLPYITNLTPADFAQIVSADPWLSPGYQLDPTRYVKVDSLQLDGPDNPGDPIPGQGVSVDDTQVNCSTTTTTQTIGTDWGGTAGIDFFGQGEKATFVNSLTYKYTSNTGHCTGSNQTAIVDLATSTVAFHDVIDVFEDSLYRSFAYVSETQGVGLPASSAGVSGVIKNKAGQPLANQPIAVKFADGSTRKLFSNAQGNYRIFQVPPGQMTITTGNSVSTVTFVTGKPIVKQLRLSVASSKVGT